MSTLTLERGMSTLAASTDDQGIIDEAIQFLRDQSDAESGNRQQAKEDIEFSFGQQWPAEVYNSRFLEGRPCLTINKTDTFIRKICNAQRQQRPRIRVHAVGDQATKKTADVIAGIIRHVEVNSAADTAYDTAFESAVRGGWGYFRITTGFEREDSFDQDIKIETIDNPFTVYQDGKAVDGSDSTKTLITDMMTKVDFHTEYPNADDGTSWYGIGSESGTWMEKTNIRIAEYFRVRRKKETLLKLSSGETIWEGEYDDLPAQAKRLMKQSGIAVIEKRESFRRYVEWFKMTALEILERRVWAGRYIPVIPVIGNVMIKDNHRERFGVVRFARDPQVMSNFWKTAATEVMALAPKPKWLVADGQDEGYESEFADANRSNRAVLHYKTQSSTGDVIGAPSRVAPEPPPQGMLEMVAMADQDLSATLGMIDPAMRIGGNVSGKALQAERLQSDESTFNFYDNFTRSLRFAGIQILDLTPKIFDTERVMRIIGEDGRPSQTTVNELHADDQAGVMRVLNDVTVGTYDITMDTGPGYQTKLQEGLDTFNGMMGANKILGEEIAKTSGDLLVRMSDAPYSEQIADRMAAGNPLANIDDQSDVPPQAQMMIKQLQKQNQDLTQHAQQLEQQIKLRIDTQTAKDIAATHRAQLQIEQADRSDKMWTAEEGRQVDSVEKTKMHVAHTQSFTALSVAEINAVRGLLEKHLGHAQALALADQAADHAQDAAATQAANDKQTEKA